MASAVGTLAINLVARTGGLVKGFGQASRKMQGLSAFAGIGTAAVGGLGLAIVGAAKAGVGAITSLVRTQEEFNRALNQSLAIMGDVTDALRGDMVQAALEVSRTTTFSAKQAAQSYFFLASAGLNAEQAIAALPQVAKFAQAGMFDMATATDLLTDAQSALGLSSKDAQVNLRNMTRVSDVLVKANTLANASVEQFSRALTNRAGAAARALGKTVEETTAVLAAFADQGIKGEVAGTKLDIVWRDLQTQAVKQKEAFKLAGVAVFDAGGEMRNTADIVENLENLLAGASDETQKMALMTLGFTDKSIAATKALLGTSAGIRRYEEELKNAAGTTAEVAEKQLTPMQKALAKLNAAWERLAFAIAPLKVVFVFMLNILAKVLNVLAKMVAFVTGTGEAYRKMKAAAEGAAKASKEVAAAGDKASKAVEGHTSAADKFLKKMEEQKKATKNAKDAAKLLEDQMKSGKRVFENTRTPVEKLKAKMADLRSLLKVGAIDWNTYQRAVMAAQGELSKAKTGRTISAVKRGSADFFKAVAERESRQNARRNPLFKINKDILDEQKKQTKVLEDIKTEAEKPGVAVTEVSF